MARTYLACECCGRITSAAHYRLVEQADERAPFRNVRLCVACFHAGCDSEHECLAYPTTSPTGVTHGA